MRDIVKSIEEEYLRYKKLGESALAQVADADLSKEPPGNGNSLAALVWHISGNLESRFTDFRTSDGEKPTRDRDSEFVPRDVTRAELVAKWERGWAPLLAEVQALADADLAATMVIRDAAAADRSGAAPLARARRLSRRADGVSGQAVGGRPLGLAEHSDRPVGRVQCQAGGVEGRPTAPRMYLEKRRQARRRGRSLMDASALSERAAGSRVAVIYTRRAPPADERSPSS